MMKNRVLKDVFIVPPISVLDVKQKYWKDRRNMWLSMGIQSELGRNENLLGLSTLLQTKQKSTSIFDPVLTESMYTWFTKEDDSILDPFSGGSVRGIVASKLKREYYGVDIRQDQVMHNEKQAKDICDSHLPKWINGSSATCSYDRDFDFIFTCPPYYNLERYSDMDEDLSVMSAQEFETTYRKIIERSVKRLRNDRFCAIVVGDVRDKDGLYLGLPQKTVEYFESAGCKLYNELVLLQEPATAAMRSFRYMNSSRKIAKAHQNIFVFAKGDPIAATQRLPTFTDKEDIYSIEGFFK